jgi:S-adenosylmethionine hydrolase
LNGKIVALLSDFGSLDAYVGIMKGVILSQDPAIRIIDLAHQVRPFDLLSAGYLLYTAWDYLPPGSAFCAVVDPGVGGKRGALLAEVGGRYLIAPDNGLISLLLRMRPGGNVHALLLERIVRPGQPEEPSGTFHGRDLFAPAAAMCARGRASRIRGARIRPVLLPAVFPDRGSRTAAGRILHIDRFGNCISSLHESDLETLKGEDEVSIRIGALRERSIRTTYSEVEVGQPLCLLGSSGFLEVSVREGSAAELLGISQSQLITVSAVDR